VLSLLATGAESAVGAHAEQIVLRLLLQLLAILVTTRAVVWVARRLGQTDVAGEILAGLLLGPSCLGALFPETMHALFDPSTSVIFVGLAQIGLLLLMFQIGLEFEFAATLGQSKRTVVAVSLAGLLVPFVSGFAAAPWFHAQLEAPQPGLLGFRLFFAVAMSITAIPILGRIFLELGLAHTRTAALTIGSAAIDDVAGWLLLGVVSLLVREEFSARWLGLRVLGLGGYLLVVFFLVKPVARKLLAKQDERGADGRRAGLSAGAIAWLLILLFASAAITSTLGVFAIIGGFTVGVALHQERAFVEAWRERVAPLAQTLLLPVFFAYTGLRTDIGTLRDGHEAWLCVLVCALAFASKLGGAFVGARWTGESLRSAATIAVCMNTRALMELIVINIGFDLGVIPRSMFTKLVIMAIASTFLATPAIRWLMRGEARPVQAR
jgi:Kef-type K+ transport system membrane component KefB